MSQKTSKQKKIPIFRLAVTGMMAAMVFVATYLHIDIPMVLGNKSMIHLGNVMCLLSGLQLGPLYGGFAAGIGSFFYDLIDPVYIATSPLTFLFKFMMAFVCGMIVYHGQREKITVARSVVGAVSGAITYVILYICKSFVELWILGSAPAAAFIAVLPKMATSSINAIIAVVVAVPLSFAIRQALKATHLTAKLSM